MWCFVLLAEDHVLCSELDYQLAVCVWTCAVWSSCNWCRDRWRPALCPPLTCRVQVYSFGVTLWEIMERKRPFAGMDGFQIQTQVHSALVSVTGSVQRQRLSLYRNSICGRVGWQERTKDGEIASAPCP